MAYRYSGDFKTRLRSFWDRFDGREELYGSELDNFSQYESTQEKGAYSPDDIKLLFLGQGSHPGLFEMAGNFGRKSSKPYAKNALLAIYNILHNESTPIMTNVFRHMPVSDLRRMKLWKHMLYGTPDQQMAAFRLARVLYHTYPTDQFRTILNNKPKALEKFNLLHEQWLREQGGTAPAPGISQAQLQNIPLPPAPVVAATTQPVLQEVVQPIEQTIVQPVLQQPEIVQVEKPAIVNAPLENARIVEPTVVNEPISEFAEGVDRSMLPPKPIVEATTQKIVQPVLQPMQQTIVQPVIQEPAIVQVEKPAIIQPATERPMIQKETLVKPAIHEAESNLPAGMLPPKPIVEATTQPIVQPVLQQVKQTVVQPVVLQPEIVHVTKPEIVLGAEQMAPIVKETLVAPPIVMPTKLEAGVKNLALGEEQAFTETLPGSGAEPLAQSGDVGTGFGKTATGTGFTEKKLDTQFYGA